MPGFGLKIRWDMKYKSWRENPPFYRINSGPDFRPLCQDSHRTHHRGPWKIRKCHDSSNHLENMKLYFAILTWYIHVKMYQYTCHLYSGSVPFYRVLDKQTSPCDPDFGDTLRKDFRQINIYHSSQIHMTLIYGCMKSYKKASSYSWVIHKFINNIIVGIYPFLHGPKFEDTLVLAKQTLKHVLTIQYCRSATQFSFYLVWPSLF